MDVSISEARSELIIRVANRLYETLLKANIHRQDHLIYPSELENLEKCIKKITTFQNFIKKRSLNETTAKILQIKVRDMYELMNTHISNLKYNCDSYIFTKELKPQTLLNIYKDIEGIQNIFSETQLSNENGHWTISATTEPITLNDIYLGNFRIDLFTEIQDDDGQFLYDIVALDPHPPEGEDHVTHPHVNSEHLCEGAAELRISNALSEARIFDFFNIIKSILVTYNPESPYVKLEHWHGLPCWCCNSINSRDDLIECCMCLEDNLYCHDCINICSDCGDPICNDHAFSCSSCNVSMCKECMSSCNFCGEILCTDCIVICDSCNAFYCENCMEACDVCEILQCANCVTECCEDEKEEEEKNDRKAKPRQQEFFGHIPNEV